MEISSYQLEDIHYGPHIAVILDIVPEHLDRYQSFESYVAAKSNIVKFQTPKDYVVYNPKRKIPAKIASQSPAQKVPVEPDNHSVPGLAVIPVENRLAAAAVADIFSMPARDIRQALTKFQPLPHRLEKIAQKNGIIFYDDSISTIPQSTIHALNALGKNVETLIAGGFDRGLDYSELGKFLAARRGLKNLILFPDTGEKIWQAVLAAASKQKSPLHLMKLPVSSMKQAVRIAFTKTAKGKICLLSPAAASYNLFKNFQVRGDEFKKQILRGRIVYSQ
jgi:UDP-N-acetylmuramoylalanine--D-glutamate ligase